MEAALHWIMACLVAVGGARLQVQLLVLRGVDLLMHVACGVAVCWLTGHDAASLAMFNTVRD
jgi:hypothetical protein